MPSKIKRKYDIATRILLEMLKFTHFVLVLRAPCYGDHNCFRLYHKLLPPTIKKECFKI